MANSCRKGDRYMTVATAPTACGMRRRVPAEERSDDEDRTSLVTDRREKEIRSLLEHLESLHLTH